MAYADQMPASRRATTVAGVVAAHLLIGYVFMSGMAVDFARSVSKTLTITNVPIETLPPPETLPEPQPVRQTAHPTPKVDMVKVDPIVKVPGATGPVMVTVDQPQPVIVPLTPPPPIVETPPPPAASRAAVVKANGNKAGWISTDDYPAAALRAGEEGVVGISVTVGTNGRVTSCQVTAPSGSSALDQASCRLYPRNARFVAARDDAGNAVQSTYVDRVRWQLPRN